MNQRIVIITGANSGIGKAAAHRFAKEGHTVIMACRSPERSRPVLDEVIAESNNSQVELMQLDVSSFRSIKTFSKVFRQKFNKLDILIHNAGYFEHGSPYRLSENGIELTFATNVAGPFLLTMELTDLMKQSDDARILMAGSNIIKHFFNPKLEINFSNLRGEEPFDPKYRVYDYYRDSKMALLMLTKKMAKNFRVDGIAVNMLQINGATMSKETIAKLTPGYRFAARIQNLFFRPPEFMANHYYDICTDEKFKGISGELINHKQEIIKKAEDNPGAKEQFIQVTTASRCPLYAYETEAQDKVWDLCTEMTESE
jgi:NAD(P)-dependent dehydrogenase (short-subunit alcohol dehydrogenase family)